MRSSTRETHSFGEGFRTVVDPLNKPAFLGFVHASYTCSTEMLDEFGEGDPSCGVHVQMMLVLDEFLVDIIGFHSLGTPSEASQICQLVGQLL